MVAAMRTMMTIGLVLMSALAQKVQAEPAIKIGYVDTEMVLQGLLEFKEVDREARTKIEVKEEEGQAKLEAIRKLEEELSVMSEEQRKARYAEFNRMRQELYEFQQQTREEILERQSVDLKRIANKIKAAIEKLSREQGFTLVLDVKPVLYLNPAQVVDLTDKVTQMLNSAYEQERQRLQRKAPARVE